MSGDELLRSQLVVMKNDNDPQYKEVISHLEAIRDECAKDIWSEEGAEKPKVCSEHNYKYLLGVKSAN